MEREGTLAIRKHGERFEVMFGRNDRGGLLTPCYVAGREALRDLLEKKMDIRRDIVKDILDILGGLKDGSIEYQPGVRLTDELRFELGLVSPDEGLSQSPKT